MSEIDNSQLEGTNLVDEEEIEIDLDDEVEEDDLSSKLAAKE